MNPSWRMRSINSRRYREANRLPNHGTVITKKRKMRTCSREDSPASGPQRENNDNNYIETTQTTELSTEQQKLRNRNGLAGCLGFMAYQPL